MRKGFHSRFRSECLNREWFLNLLGARTCIEVFRDEYDTVRPHSSLSYRSPIEVYDPEGFGLGPRLRLSLIEALQQPTIHYQC